MKKIISIVVISFISSLCADTSGLSTQEVMGLLNLDADKQTSANNASSSTPKTPDVNAMRQGMAQEVLSHLSDIEQKLDAMDGKLNQLLKACGASTPQTASIPPATPPKKTTQKPVPPQPTAPVVTTIPQQTVVAPAQAAATQELISELRNSPDLDKRLQELKEFTDSEGIKSKKPMLRKLLEEKLGEQSPAPSH